MSKMRDFFRKIRRKAGVLYWKVHRVVYYRWFRIKRYWVNVAHYLSGFAVKSDFSKIKDYDCIVICAHPDDETIFFSGVLKENKPYVVCMSNRGNSIRNQEFKKALLHWNVEGCMMNIPDATGHFGWAWEGRGIRKTLKKIAKNCTNLTCVYTHNTKGESNHRHHHGLGTAVAEVFSDYDIYVTAETLEVPDTPNNAMYTEKYEILSRIYPSQYKHLETCCGWFYNYLSQEKFEKINSRKT